MQIYVAAKLTFTPVRSNVLNIQITQSGPLRNVLNGPDADLVVGVSGKQNLAISRPGKRNTLRWLRLLTNINKLGVELINEVFGFQVPDLDSRLGGGAEPVAVGREAERIDDRTGLERVQVLAIVEIPEHSNTVFATRGAKRTVGRNGDGVDVASVAVVVGLELALGKIPNLNN